MSEEFIPGKPGPITRLMKEWEAGDREAIREGEGEAMSDETPEIPDAIAQIFAKPIGPTKHNLEITLEMLKKAYERVDTRDLV